MSLGERKGLHPNHFKLNIRCLSLVKLSFVPCYEVIPMGWLPQSPSGHSSTPCLGAAIGGQTLVLLQPHPPPSASHLSDNLQNLPKRLWHYLQYSSVIDHLPGSSSPHSIIFAWSLLFLNDREIETSLSASHILSLDHSCQLPIFSFAGTLAKPLGTLLPLRMTQHVICPNQKDPFRDTFWYQLLR